MTQWLLISNLALPLVLLPVHAATNHKDTALVFHQSLNLDQTAFIQALKHQLEQKMPNHQIKFIDVTQISKREIKQYFTSAKQCALSIGKAATQKMLSVRKPINHFSVLVSRSTLDQLHKVYSRLGIQVTGIYQEQSFSRQLFLAKAINPSLKSVAIMLDQSDKHHLIEYEKAARNHNVELKYQLLRPTDPPEKYFNKITDPETYLLITNNSQLYMRSKLASLVLSAYYHQIKLIGSRFEDVKAGALASIYTAPSSLSIETSNEFKKICRHQTNNHKTIMPPRYAKNFNVIVNKQIAENLKINIISNSKLSKTISQMEAR